ncbi:hypothetical protein G7062_00070 [Erysipelothrix sp. HDW6C]|uniref:hypothetical protein n=1 Tax=Erysipelothrix sp. HDW6C TaxID=2714930 RepID=UPI00140E73F2|nr:hypothetical protein [Erysipelothrix sp. HDW6C]QIK68771.1 hypothetical protein G7062_00070 [Erysipelothrix sp. HDW6C]
MRKIVKEIRKFDAGTTLATQELNNVLVESITAIGTSLISNLQYKMFLQTVSAT